ncbi:hypothetical protein E4N62_16675 [Streptomyces sp. MNU76]|uniref:hypothetical protein n=1 Tax=Streptomyces sp. MNU76 TaxID=2560026 RepID=UPI001E4139AE|nr:hypothetical protein [Streptomyces sp. MNU76]MCC9706764.1 hypothetical protein [Streptomyces sp. MNU76]
MTEPTQPGPYTGQPVPQPQPMASAPGWAPPPQQGAPSPYATTPPAGYGRPASPPGDPAATADRVSGGLLIPAALFAVGASFATLTKSVQYLDDASEEPSFTTIATAWSYTNGATGEPTQSVTRFAGVMLLVVGLLAIATALLLLTGRARRLPVGPALGVGSAVLLLGTTLSVLTEALDDTQWDTEGRTTSFGLGFALLIVACLLALGATVTTVLGTRRPATAFPGPAQPSQPPQPPQLWQAAPGGVPGAPGAPGAPDTPGAPGAQAAAQPAPPFPPAQPPAPPTQG